ncbi:hypothetical protein [Gryllotalpicola daejeonensis]|uniref:hypothetical protein n=1 Tax=Gryllotalpicola daejeonensis TaxID=993087 RepID=UPI0031E23FD3
MTGAVWPAIPGLMVMLLVGGTAIAPLIASSSQLVQACVASSRITEAFTWVNTASATGIAAAAALTGTLVTAHGVSTATAAVIGLVTIAAGSAAVNLGSESPAR